MAREGHEFGRHCGLGWIDATVERMGVERPLRLPHVGWSDLHQVRESVLFEGIPQDALFYYVHSFHMVCADQRLTIGEDDYGRRFTAAVQRGNIFGTQFHPEKSQHWGLQLLKNFLQKG
jgi:glutamine amidotransferase